MSKHRIEDVVEDATLTSDLPRVAIGSWPTPVQSLRQFAARHHLHSLWIKREDLSHEICGGNKVRGLELLLGLAKKRNVKSLVSFSSAGSHHLSKTAWHADQHGMHTTAIIVPQPNAAYVRANIALALSVGAEYVPANYVTVLPKTIWHWLVEQYGERRTTMMIPPGGTSTMSMLGHASAALELKAQIEARVLPMPDYLYVALGSLGTACGLAAGLHLANLKTRVVGVIVSHRWYCTHERLKRLTRAAYRAFVSNANAVDAGSPKGVLQPPIVEDALGSGYAQFAESAMRCAAEFEETEGLPLDGTYTAKTVDGMLNFIKRNHLQDKNHLLWYTYSPPPSVDVDVNALPSAIRRYFEEPVQPLDRSIRAES